MTEENSITKQELIYACIDSWLPLNDKEKRQFEREISKLPAEEQAAVRQLIAECEATRPRWEKDLSGDPKEQVASEEQDDKAT